MFEFFFLSVYLTLKFYNYQLLCSYFSLDSAQFSHSVVSDSVQPHELHTRKASMLHCPSPTPGAYSIHVHQDSDAIHPAHPLLSPSPPSFNHFQHQGLSQWVSSSHQVAKVLKFQLQYQSFQRIFRIEWLDLSAVQWTLKSLLQHHSSKASILQRSVFFILQLLCDRPLSVK